jgi:hypothetical protein
VVSFSSVAAIRRWHFPGCLESPDLVNYISVTRASTKDRQILEGEEWLVCKRRMTRPRILPPLLMSLRTLAPLVAFRSLLFLSPLPHILRNNAQLSSPLTSYSRRQSPSTCHLVNTLTYVFQYRKGFTFSKTGSILTRETFFGRSIHCFMYLVN